MSDTKQLRAPCDAMCQELNTNKHAFIDTQDLERFIQRNKRVID